MGTQGDKVKETIQKIEIQNLQREIKEILKTLGWSVRRFASKFVIDTSDRDVPENEVFSFQEKVKKQLKRTTTKREKLNDYLIFIKKSDEYSKLSFSDELPIFAPLTGLFSDYPIILKEESNEVNRQVLEVAAAYALSIGSAWSFNVISVGSDDYYDNRYVVIWEGDVGHNCGSGTWGPAMCEVVESHFGSLFVDSAEHKFDTSLRCIDEVNGYMEGDLIISGRRYDENDSNNHPSLKYIVTLRKNTENKWELNEEKFLHKIHF